MHAADGNAQHSNIHCTPSLRRAKQQNSPTDASICTANVSYIYIYIYIYDMQYLQLPKWICFPERLGRPIREA